VSLAEIRKRRGVPAKRGMRVLHTHNMRFGQIKSARGGYLRIQLDGDRFAGNYHPTWKLVYFDADGKVIYPQETEEAAS
jgi:hypothetical protein